jgi:SAM-dependent methyltransferase
MSDQVLDMETSAPQLTATAPFSFRAFYCNLNFFGTPQGYDVVAAVILPDTFGEDVNGLRIRCVETGKIAGKVVSPGESPWPDIYASVLAPGFRVVQADLAEFAPVGRNDKGEATIPSDIKLEVVDAFGEPISPGFYECWSSLCTLPIPPRDNITRVAGDIGSIGFLFGGATWHTRIENLARCYLGRETKELERILDWGVGCGRVARHFLERGQTNIYGADIDAVNIDWLRKELRWNNATCIDLDPPMPYPDDHFDLVYGHSVFTHLSQFDHFLWINEIKRILKPGGIALLTVTTEDGLYAARHRNFPKELSQLYAAGGFLDIEDQSYVGLNPSRSGYYRLVYQSRKFIMENWGKLFAIPRVIPCYFQHSDLVIARK